MWIVRVCRAVTSDMVWKLYYAEFRVDFGSGLHFDLKGRTSEHSLSLSWGLFWSLSQSKFGSKINPLVFEAFDIRNWMCFLPISYFTTNQPEIWACKYIIGYNFHYFLWNFAGTSSFFMKPIVFVFLSIRRSRTQIFVYNGEPADRQFDVKKIFSTKMSKFA